MNMHFEQYYMTSITDRLYKCPNITNIEKALEDNQKTLLAWKRDNDWKAVLIASALSQPVADVVLMYSDARDIWDELVSV